MLIVNGHIQIDPAKLDEAREVFGRVATETRKEDGNEAYEFSESLHEPGRIIITERWASEDALNEHMTTPHMAEFIGAMGGLGVQGADVVRYDVSGSQKLM